ncbi:MAG: F0F1 ATP synthase subunit B [Pseudomonadota bacterium]|nr:F0F1 ATP synthase subunit B [Pseudomonadota bacterium]MDO7667817.1 F0F1 ATP synthase subunit B [Pseudomonadota bacterium]MDO7710392.1 F0F1 ATP synthase subunit B [Pseudomonadota bacterium]
MLIDWFTVAAQIINFLVLMWLLKHFLYRPVLNAIDAREKRIHDQLALAKKTQTTATNQRLEFEDKNKNFEQQHEILLEKARAEAQATRQQLLADARNEALTLRTQWQEALSKEQHNLTEGIATRVRQEVLDVSRKLLTELADHNLEIRMVAIFIKQLQSLDDAEKAQLCTQVEDATCPIIIRSAFELPEAERTTLTQQVKTTLAMNSAVQFEIEPELISGIELISSGHKIAWNIADYLSALETSISSLLNGKQPENEAQ